MTSRTFQGKQTGSRKIGRSSYIETDILQFLDRSRLHLSTVCQDFQRARGCLDETDTTSEHDRDQLPRLMEEIVDNYLLNLSYVLKVLMQFDVNSRDGVYALYIYVQHGAWDKWAEHLQGFASDTQHLSQSTKTKLQVPLTVISRLSDTCLYLSAIAESDKCSEMMGPTVDGMRKSVASCLQSRVL